MSLILLIKKDCPHCTPELSAEVESKGGQVLEVVRHADGTPHIKVSDSMFSPLPEEVMGLPALFDNGKMFMGSGPINKHLHASEIAVAS